MHAGRRTEPKHVGASFENKTRIFEIKNETTQTCPNDDNDDVNCGNVENPGMTMTEKNKKHNNTIDNNNGIPICINVLN